MEEWTDTSKVKRAPPFPWNDERTYVALQIFAHNKPYDNKSGTPESTATWTKIVEDLKKSEDPMFKQHDITVKKVRDHLNQTLKKRQVIKNALDKQSGIVQDTTPLQDLLDQVNEERTERIEHFTSQRAAQTEKEAEQEKRSEDARLKAMETMAETKKRKSEDGESSGKDRKERKTGSEMVAFMAKRSEERREERKEELAIRQRDLDVRTQQAEMTNNAMLTMMRCFQDQQRAQLEAQRIREEAAAKEREERREMDRVRNEQQNALMKAMIDALNRK
jgi:hypothetical protein